VVLGRDIFAPATRTAGALVFAFIVGTTGSAGAQNQPIEPPRRPEQPSARTANAPAAPHAASTTSPPTATTPAAAPAATITITATPATASTPTSPKATRGDELAPPSDASAAVPGGHFEFGSYGRVNVASDLRGRTGRGADIVAYGSRVDDDSYAELELRREDTFEGGIRSRVVATLALFPPFFHFSGVPDDKFGVRQLYAQATQNGWTVWGGARMYRGDDIYLLNWWPLDNQNTIGGGIGKSFGDTTVALHAGMQRLDVPSQYQQIPSPKPYSIGATNVTVLDRPRTAETAKVTHLVHGLSGPGATDGLKLSLYGELQQMAAGVARDVTIQSQYPLPQNNGWLLGSQVVYFTGVRDTYASFIVRYANGLAVYDMLAAPTSLANDHTTKGASEALFAVAGNFDERSWGVQWGGYLRFFRGATEAATSLDSFDEGIMLVRPHLYLSDHIGIGIEGSYQSRRYAVIDPTTDEALTASLVRGALLPFFSPSGRGAFARPHIGLVYAITGRNEGARSLYPPADPFSWRTTEHYFGLAVEWWFNQSSYP
jgi:maltoporin